MSGSGRGRPHGRPGAGLEEIERLYVDGSNLLHRRGGMPTATSSRTLLASLGAALPPAVDVVLLLDGQPDPGAPSQERVRPGLTVRYAGRVDADSVLVSMVSGQTYREALRTVVVTDDRALGDRVRHAGGRTERLDWLERLLAAALAGTSLPGPAAPGPRSTSISRGRPAAGSPPPDEETERASWQPGRGATRKRGNPKRGHPPG